CRFANTGMSGVLESGSRLKVLNYACSVKRMGSSGRQPYRVWGGCLGWSDVPRYEDAQVIHPWNSSC
ncbi:MAG TPA: hypothetical protein VN673_10905, partial [Clostridia bacterium]|nr:hypothetical protein [Clostridia bacterium]